jgi:hypothetical protein
MLSETPGGDAGHTQRRRDAAADASAGTIIPLQSKRLHRADFMVGLAEELPAVFTVFAAAASALQGEHDAAGYALAAAEVVAGAGVLVAIALEARHLYGRRAAQAHGASHQKPRIDASTLAAATLGFVEAWHRAHVVGHFKLISPPVVGAVASLLTGSIKRLPVSERRKRRRPHVGVTHDGISYFGGLRRKWRATWAEVAAVEHDGKELVLRLRDGQRHVLRANDHVGGESVLAETRAAIAAHAPHLVGAVEAR